MRCFSEVNMITAPSGALLENIASPQSLTLSELRLECKGKSSDARTKVEYVRKPGKIESGFGQISLDCIAQVFE